MDVYIIPATKGRKGWMTAHRHGDVVEHGRVSAVAPAAVRAEVEALFPDATIHYPKAWPHAIDTKVSPA